MLVIPPIPTTSTRRAARSTSRRRASASTASRSLSPSTSTATAGSATFGEEVGDESVHALGLLELEEVAGVGDQLQPGGGGEVGGGVLGVRRLHRAVVLP